MRKTLGFAALMLALCYPALAGEIPTPPAPQPQKTTAQEPTTANEDTTGAADTLTQIVLNLLVSVLP
jgi:hypothetical protein